ncbi:MAG: AAA family ATPase [Phycicoccus sp.]|nr:AAA family ATPase [Phycicoccus sp.]
MRIRSLTLRPYGECADVTIEFGRGLTVVLGANEAGKSTALDALTDLLWAIPLNTSRASRVRRKDLRILAEVQTAEGTSTLTRSPSGLFGADQFTPAIAPWDREQSLDRSWWRTRFGISHEQLREGGREVFEGKGDLAELVFAAREGASARALRSDIAAQVDVLFKAHKGNKGVALRKAYTSYAEADAQLRSVLTGADMVSAQRSEVKRLEVDYARAKGESEQAARTLQGAREDKRVITHVLGLRSARAHVDRIAAEGDRLTPEELAQLAQADERRDLAQAASARLTRDIADRMAEVDQLVVEEPLLAVEQDVDRLAASLEARLADLKRADDEYLPEVERTSDDLRRRLLDIGVDAGVDLDKAIAATRVRADYAAALNELTDRHEALTADLEEAAKARAAAERTLLGYGIQLDPAKATVPDATAVTAAKNLLSNAFEVLTTQKGLEQKARDEIQELEASAPSTPTPAHTTREDVDSHRHARDLHWSSLREVWLTGELPEPAERGRSADDLTASIVAADGVSDVEADERERLASEVATAQAHVAGLAKKQQELTGLLANIAESAANCDALQRDWDGLWQSYGVSAVPDLDHSAAVLELLTAWHKEQFAASEAAAKIAALEAPWRVAAEPAGLDSAVTVAVWRTRADILKQIDDLDTKRIERSRKEAEARTQWAGYEAEARSHLAGLGVEIPSAASPSQIENGVLQLQKRLVASRTARTSRTGLLQRIDELKEEVAQAGREIADAGSVRTRLGESHGADPAAELDVLAKRAREAQGYLDAEQESLGHLRTAMDPGSDSDDVASRLGSDDEVAVDSRLAEAAQHEEHVDEEAASALELLTAGRISLKDMEGSGGAAVAQAALASHQARVAHLTEQWATLALQQHLLDRTLDTYGSQDSCSLLRRAGEILDRLTVGRWVALSANEDQGKKTLVVLRSDGETLEPSGLSEGTADQVFLALRLAAVAEQHADRLSRGEPALPFVLDDALIAFDDSRTNEALHLLHELAEDLQVVVFTHHEHVASAAEGLDGAVVSRMDPPEAVSGALDAEELRDRVQRPSQSPGASLPTAIRRPTSELDLTAVRAWARDQGVAVAERGRVAQDVLDKYLRATQ